MTEGIIQEVFDKIIKERSPWISTVEIQLLRKTEQELIEKIIHGIRREINNPESDFYISPEDAELLIKYIVGESK